MESIKYKDYTINIEQDEADDNPIEWDSPADRGATYALKMNRYDLPFEIDADLDDYELWTEFAEANAPKDQPVYKMVHWYEHSGIAVSLRDTESSDGWDAGIAGVIFGESAEAIESTFEVFKAYVEGDIWRVSVTDPDGDDVDQLGYIMGYDQAILEGEYIVDYALSQPRVGHKPKKASELHN